MGHTNKLMDQLAAHVRHGDHLCVICEDPRDRLAAAAQYIADGLRQNECVMYAADAATTETLRDMLRWQGIDVEFEIARGALSMPTAHDAYLRDGEFNPDVIYNAFDEKITSAKDAGFSGCRFAGEPIWAIDREELRPGLIEFESRLNELFRSRKAAGLCVYDRKKWPATVVRDILRTHPVAVVDDVVCERNLYYERADLIDQEQSTEQQVSWMLSQLRELHAQDTRLQIALEAGKLGSWELDLASDTSVRSLRHDQIFGYDRPQANWGYEKFLRHVVPEDREQVDAAFRHSIKAGSTWTFECRIRRHSDDTIRWIEAHGRPDPAGSTGRRVQRLLGIVADITERKELEQALRDADRRKDEFLATLAHELRNPLAPIINALHIMRSKSAEDSQLQRMQNIIDRQTRHLVRLVDDLLEVSRISTGRIVLRREQIELGSVLASAIEASEPVIKDSGHTFSVAVPEQPIHLQGDATRLAQVFLNVLNNAAKYTPRGGHIELTASQRAGIAEVRIRDNGLGIRTEFLPDIFKMFVQGGPDGERHHGGLGIGLPLAKQLLELHGGSIEAHSDGPGMGSEFIIRLPVKGKQESPDRAPVAAADNEPSSLRILVVDDNVDAADSLAESLRSLGHTTATCYDGRSGLQTAEQFEPDIAILDIGLPDLDGYEVARQLRVLQPAVTLVALTGWGQEEDRNRATEAGFDLHRTKPAAPADLLTAILDATSNHEATVR